MGVQIETVPAGKEAPEGNKKRNPWVIAQFALAAASALPLLWVGGLHGWPWEHKAATANSATGVAQPATPVSIAISRLNINAPLDPLTLDPTTEALNPPSYGHAGWYGAGPQPGEVGRAVVEGHRTNPNGSDDVFATLPDTRTGDQITVTTSTGKVLHFSVTSVETFDTSSVPMDRVFGTDGSTAQLRIIAPSGSAAGQAYSQDVIVFADLTS